MSQVSIIGGLGSALCLSFIWPFCFQRQYGVKGFLRTCPCLTAIPGTGTLCSTSSNTACDCGWLGENDHAYFGTDEERAAEEERERAMRQAWANRILMERQREQILGGVKGGVGVIGERFHGVGGKFGQRVHGVTDRIPLGLFGQVGRTPGGRVVNVQPGVAAAMEAHTVEDIEKGLDMGIDAEGVGGMPGHKRKSIIQGSGVRNLDDIVGGNRLRTSRPGSVLYDGAPGVESPADVQRRRSSRVGRSGSGVARSGSAATRGRNTSPVTDANEPPLNRGTMASQTVVQRQYGPTAPMVISSSEMPDSSGHK